MARHKQIRINDTAGSHTFGKLCVVRIHPDGGIHYGLHLPPNPLFRHVREFPYGTSRVDSRLKQDLIGHPVTYPSAEGLVHDHPLDRRSGSGVEEVQELRERRMREVRVEPEDGEGRVVQGRLGQKSEPCETTGWAIVGPRV